MKRWKQILLAFLACICVGVVSFGISACDFSQMMGGSVPASETQEASEREESQNESSQESASVCAHSWEEVVVKKSDCETKGMLAKVCKRCGATESETISELGHDIVKYGAMQPTCTQVGWEAYEMCDRDGCNYTTYVEKPALGHTGGSATCKEKAICGRCFTAYGEFGEHTLVYYAEKAATCENIGWDEYEKCKLCDYTTYVEKPALGHNYVKGICERCKEEDPYYVEGHEHIYDRESITTQATCTTSGIKTLSCECGAAKTETTSLTSVTIGNSVTSIGDSAFMECEGLTSITIPDSVTSIGELVFGYCTGLTSVVIGDSVKSIDQAFYRCTGLTSITIPASVTSIGNDAFAYCSSLTSVTIPDSVTSIGYEAFASCTGLTSVTIGDSVTSIRMHAFGECANLTTVYYKGAAEEWNTISIGGSNSKLTSATRYYYSEGEPTLNASGTTYDGNYWHYVDGEITVWVYVKKD